jgi:aryl-alcohol dehydrogenase-like predicted oxidoreductase
VVSSKYYWGIDGAVPNMQYTLNRKYLTQAVDGSLERMQLDFLDLIYCHRPDPATPIEETVWAMSDLVSSGKALYWGTSEWAADEIRAAWEIAERHHLHKPIVEQPQYNLLSRRRVEQEYARLYDEIGIGTTIWSPLASGLLTGKYATGIPADSRGALPGYEWIGERLTDGASLAKVEKLRPIAAELGCTLAQLSIAWCAKNPHVSTVITGASRASQVVENFAALEVIDLLSPEVMERIEHAVR